MHAPGAVPVYKRGLLWYAHRLLGFDIGFDIDAKQLVFAKKK